ncbi:glutaredoxin family protein [Paraferrimonas sp. SM1919]|uniref:glutaredoxin family protein n=1 Tax=Paraferrimonas sp. SM1919 TaxID=2662263 RepID=UPI0013CF8AAD|nr:glutaredoxin family protein [Paraferrimonas sp. SM1919]
MSDWVLYHTDGCHLCEIAQSHLSKVNVQYRLKDICDEQALVDKYGICIPVFANQAGDKELFWPFDLQQLQQFLEQ